MTTASPTDDRFSIAVLPFLKTSDRFRLAGFEFRSATDLAGLSMAQATAVREVAEMLYHKDEDRLEGATFAIVPYLAFDRGNADTALLEDIHAVIAYLYATPHELYGDPFLSTEHASMVLFSPDDVPVSLVGRQGRASDGHTLEAREGNERHHVPGYSGLYNFRHPLWVARGSRVYGPAPHMTLNLSQDLSRDLDRRANPAHIAVLLDMLGRQRTSASLRILTAIRWCNSASSDAVTDPVAIVHLAIAFETLLALPQSDKTDRIVDTIALLLGRVPRLDVWAQQFYAARSSVVHEGDTAILRFVVADSRKATVGPEYQSLLAYGRQIFRLCLATLVTGFALAEDAGLADRFVPNHERFDTLCSLLGSSQMTACERLERAEPLVAAIERYRFAGDSGLRLASMIGALRLAAAALLACDSTLTPEATAALEGLVKASRTDELEQLEAIRNLEALSPAERSEAIAPHNAVVRRLVKTVWESVFMHYYWLKDRPQTT